MSRLSSPKTSKSPVRDPRPLKAPRRNGRLIWWSFMGFVSPEDYIAKELQLDLDQRNNIHATYGDYRTSMEGVFAGGDCRRGQSLVVWAIHEGRGVADACDDYLMLKRTDHSTAMHSAGGFANLSSLSPTL
ncbi:Glutamate synthase 1 [NADH], chloroplastic [Seminavis robusta]|uniref:Glutamate synthase 1 [NADH], chloroplastic n=1 Tax=Seminavis robusta TaxID=568900 RepID=A0A9N8EFA4_9STRA|nr:Glutamate synthase 1 [NADH], chloroplastic [Seminavis robusta]|eukprot:Sro1010_g230820.1 Glutamate synthase 1 [NADH], chloroplastic (131) ;mRNA; f:9781-10173